MHRDEVRVEVEHAPHAPYDIGDCARIGGGDFQQQFGLHTVGGHAQPRRRIRRTDHALVAGRADTLDAWDRASLPMNDKYRPRNPAVAGTRAAMQAAALGICARSRRIAVGGIPQPSRNAALKRRKLLKPAASATWVTGNVRFQ